MRSPAENRLAVLTAARYLVKVEGTYPSVRRVAKMVGMSPSRVGELLRELYAAGDLVAVASIPRSVPPPPQRRRVESRTIAVVATNQAPGLPAWTDERAAFGVRLADRIAKLHARTPGDRHPSVVDMPDRAIANAVRATLATFPTPPTPEEETR